MILGVLLAKKKYPLIKYLCVMLIVCGVALFMYKEVRLKEDGDFKVLGSKLPKVKTKYLRHTQNAYRTLLIGRFQDISEFLKRNLLDHNQSFSEFSKIEETNLKKISPLFSICNPFPSWPSVAQDTYVYF